MPNMDEEDDIRRFLIRGTGSQMGANESVKDLLDAIKTVVDAILVDSGTTLEAKLDAIKTVLDAVLMDTGTTLEAKLDAIEGSGFATGTDSLKVLSDVLDLIRAELTFQHQADAVLDQVNPVQNTWYTILDTTANARLYFIIIKVATTSETIEERITVDGQSLLSDAWALTADTWYSVLIEPRAAGPNKVIPSAYTYLAALYFPLEGRSVKVEVRKTTANGTGTLSGRVTYAKR